MYNDAMKILTALLFVLALAAPVMAQTVPVSGAEQLEWDQDGPDLPNVQAYGYNAYIDGVLDSVVAATCSGSTSPFLCTTPFPAMTPGAHSIYLTAFIPTVGGDVESLPSNTLDVILVLVPTAPQNLRIR